MSKRKSADEGRVVAGFAALPTVIDGFPPDGQWLAEPLVLAADPVDEAAGLP